MFQIHHFFWGFDVSFFFDGCKSYCGEDVGVYPSAGIPVTTRTSKFIPYFFELSDPNEKPSFPQSEW